MTDPPTVGYESRGARSKWVEFWTGYETLAYASNYGRHLYTRQAEETAKALSALPDNARVLSLGTGLGYVERLLTSRPDVGRWTVAAELVEPVLQALWDQSLPALPKPAPVRCDAYRLPFADCSFDAVISFGNACVTSYRGVAPELTRVLRPGGMVVMDFVNHLSIYQMFRWRNWKRFLRCLQLLPGGEKYHHFGPLALRSFYEQYGLELLNVTYLMAVPPVRIALSPSQYAADDRIWPLKRFFGRVLLTIFRKRN